MLTATPRPLPPARRLGRRAVVGGALAAPGVIAACATPENSSRPAGRSPAPQPVEVAYWKSLSGPRHDAQVRLVEQFNGSQEGVRVTVEHAGEYAVAAGKLRVSLASGAPPDVTLLSVNTDLPAFAREGALSPIEALARRSALLQAFYPGFVRESRVNGTLYQLPFARSVPLLYANLDLLGDGGLPSSPAAAWQPATWDGLLEVCRRTAQVLRLEEPVYGVTTGWWELQPLLWAFGGSFSDSAGVVRVADRRTIEAFQFVADLVHRHAIAVGTKRAQTEFVRGGRAFLSGSSAALTEIVDGAPFGVGALPLPARAPGVPGDGPGDLPGGGAGLSLLAASGKQDAGWDFMRFMTGPSATASFAGATGYLPVRADALDYPEVRALLRRHEGAATALAQTLRLRPVDAVLSRPSAGVRIQEIIERVVFRGEPVRPACEDLARALSGEPVAPPAP